MISGNGRRIRPFPFMGKAMTKRRAKISTAAAGGSAIAHLLLLGAFAAVNMQPAETPDGTLGAVSVQQIQQVIEQPLITEKPEVKSPVHDPEPKKEAQQTKPVERLFRHRPRPTQPPKPCPQSSAGCLLVWQQNPLHRISVRGRLLRQLMYGRLGMIQRQLKSCIAALYDTPIVC
jgi:hypothetical protein